MMNQYEQQVIENVPIDFRESDWKHKNRGVSLVFEVEESVHYFLYLFIKKVKIEPESFSIRWSFMGLKKTLQVNGNKFL